MPESLKLSTNDIDPHLRLINLFQCQSSFETGPRILYDHYFLYVHSGKGIITIGNSAYKAIPGDLFYCPPGTPNAISADDEDPFLLSGIDFDFTQNHQDNLLTYPIAASTFNPDQVTEYISFMDFDGFATKINLSSDHASHRIVLDMIHEFTVQKIHWQHNVDAMLTTFIIDVIRQHTVRRQHSKGRHTTDEIIDYLSTHFDQTLSNVDIGNRFHFNPDYVSQVVKSYTGLTLKQYIINLRIQEAMNLLRNSDMTIRNIALSVGYDNLHYFSRLFKDKTGVTPGYFRRNT